MRLALAVGCRGNLGTNLPGFRSAEGGVEGEGLLPVAVSLLAVAGGLAGAGEPRVSPCLPVFVICQGGQGQRVGVLGAGLLFLAGGQERFAQAIVRLGLTGVIAGLAMQRQSLPEMAGGPPMAALP